MHLLILHTAAAQPRLRHGARHAKALNRRKQGASRLAPQHTRLDAALAEAAIKPPRAARAR
ncbi:hypothetical protein [Paraburkholderia sp. JHI869]|uniref:hypothetical protein n=1 Tax=Paraburkholderia sp. JHI869 TaxID=3112959 RepID=UPI00316E8285